jgi:hypothetical protein
LIINHQTSEAAAITAAIIGANIVATAELMHDPEALENPYCV